MVAVLDHFPQDDQYHTGQNNSIQHANVGRLISSVVEALSRDPNRRFTYVEVAYLDEHPEIDGLGGSVEAFVEEGTAAKARTVEHPASPGHVLWSLFFGCAIAHPTSMVRQALMRRLAGYREEFKVSRGMPHLLAGV